MIDLTVPEIRDFLRADAENDIVIAPLLSTAIAYVSSAVGAEYASSADARCVTAVSLYCYDLFHATDVFQSSVTALVSQIRADPFVSEVVIST